MGHRRQRQQEELCSAPGPGLPFGFEDGGPRGLRHYRRSGQYAQPAQRFPIDRHSTTPNRLPTNSSPCPVLPSPRWAPAFRCRSSRISLLARSHLRPLRPRRRICPLRARASFPQHMNRGSIQSWNFFIQREFSPTLTAEAGYAGTHGVRKMMAVNINGSAPGTGNAGRQLSPYLTSRLQLDRALRQHEIPRIAEQAEETDWRVAVRRELHLVQGPRRSVATTATAPCAVPTRCRSAGQGLGGLTTASTLSSFTRLPVPFGKGHTLFNHGLVAHIFGGFQITGTLSRFSGLPFTLGSEQHLECRRPRAVGDPAQSRGEDPGRARPQSVFRRDRLSHPLGALGTTGRNLLRGPGWFNMDANFPVPSASKREDQVPVPRRSLQPDQSPLLHSGSHFCDAHVERRRLQELRGLSVITSTASNPRQLQVGANLRF